MRVVLLHNHSSGRGQAGSTLHACQAALRAAGHEVAPVSVGPAVPKSTLEHAVASANLVVVAGGDGTVHHALPVILRAGVPIYQLPFGTENLFAREFRMDQSPQRLTQAIANWKVAKVDTATCSGRPFVLMASVGFDANIVERVATNRTGPISKLNYVGHGLREIVAPRIPTLSIDVDGTRQVDAQPGLVVVANSRQYGARLDPAPKADMKDGLLDVVFFPGNTRLELGLWAVRTMLRNHTQAANLLLIRGRKVSVRAESATPFQLDGEYAGQLHPMTTDQRTLDIEIQPETLNVLLPPP